LEIYANNARRICAASAPHPRRIRAGSVFRSYKKILPAAVLFTANYPALNRDELKAVAERARGIIESPYVRIFILVREILGFRDILGSTVFGRQPPPRFDRDAQAVGKVFGVGIVLGLSYRALNESLNIFFGRKFFVNIPFIEFNCHLHNLL
jgi:hypothetical protein